MKHTRIMTTGGTISTTETGMIGGAALLRELGLDPELAHVSVEAPMCEPSSRMTIHDQRRLAQRIRAIANDEPDVSGVVILHGTDTMEETAFALHSLVGDVLPIVLTGAMRSTSSPQADGQANLRDAVTMAGLLESRHGPVIVMNGTVHDAATVRKLHATALDAFQSRHAIPLSDVAADPLRLDALCGRRIVRNLDWPICDDVIVVRLGIGDSGQLITLAAESSVRGLVVEVFGAGNVPDAPREAIKAAVEAGCCVVLVSRTGAGAIEVPPALEDSGVVCGHDLDGLKARIVLMLSLGATDDPRQIQAIFDQRLQ